MKMIVKKKQNLTVLRDCLVCKIEQKREKKRSLLGSSAGARSLAYRYQKTLRITHYALRFYAFSLRLASPKPDTLRFRA